jgi:hypothetical protein
MAAIRAELPVKLLPPEADDAAPPCDVAFAPERVEVLTKLVLSPGFLARPKNGNCDRSSQKEDDPKCQIRGRNIADIHSAIWDGEANTVPSRIGGENRWPWAGISRCFSSGGFARGAAFA